MTGLPIIHPFSPSLLNSGDPNSDACVIVYTADDLFLNCCTSLYLVSLLQQGF